MDIINRGLYSELRFALECVKRGIKVSTPVSSRNVYDSIVDVGDKIYRVQIKSHWRKANHNNIFELDIRRQRGKNIPYKLSEVDFFCVYVYRLDGFFVFPNKGQKTISLNPLKSKYWQNFQFNE